MRRFELLLCCEVCWRVDHVEVPADGLSEEINGVMLDLCEAHATRIPIKLLLPTLAEYGVDQSALPKSPPSKSPPSKSSPPKQAKEAKFVCDMPGCTWGPDGGPHRSKSAAGRGVHKRQRHGVVSDAAKTEK